MDSWKSSAARKKINRCRKKEDQQARNVREVAKCCVFQCFVCRLGRKVTSLKRRVRRWLFREDMKNCTPLWREAHFQVKMYKTQHSRTTFGSCDVEKLHAAVARSTFSIKMRLSLQVRTTFGSCDVEKLHAAVARSTFSIKMRLSLQVRTSFWSWDVEKLHAAVARSTFASQNAKKLTVSGHFLKCRCRKIVEKWHAAVAPRTCTSQNVQNTCVCATFGGSTLRVH